MTLATRDSAVPLNEDILARTRQNTSFREVLSTGPHAQLVLMCLPPAGEIGEEVHEDVDQVLVFVEGAGEAVLEGRHSAVSPGRLVLVPARTRHNIVNTGPADLKLYTVYTSPKHAPDAVHRTKADADADEGHA